MDHIHTTENDLSTKKQLMMDISNMDESQMCYIM